MTIPDIKVHHEWGKLKEAVVGTPIGLRMPTWSDEYEFLTPDVQQFIKTNQGKLLKDADPDLNKSSVSQMEDFSDLLRSLGVVVHRAELLTDDEIDYLVNFKAGVQQCFTRDPILVIGNNIIETSMREFERRKERFGIRRGVGDRLTEGNANWISMPQAEPVRGTSGYGLGPFLEGGDILLAGRDIYAGYSGHASNLAGINWLQRFLGPDYRVHPFAIYGVGAVTAALIGPLLMGISADALSWRVPFGLETLIVVATFFFAMRAMKETEPIEGAKVDCVLETEFYSVQ